MNFSGWELIILLAVVPFCLAVGALVSIFTRERPMEQKLLWAIIVLIAPFVGAILYFVFGRRDTSS